MRVDRLDGHRLGGIVRKRGRRRLDALQVPGFRERRHPHVGGSSELLLLYDRRLVRVARLRTDDLPPDYDRVVVRILQNHRWDAVILAAFDRTGTRYELLRVAVDCVRVITAIREIREVAGGEVVDGEVRGLVREVVGGGRKDVPLQGAGLPLHFFFALVGQVGHTGGSAGRVLDVLVSEVVLVLRALVRVHAAGGLAVVAARGVWRCGALRAYGLRARG